MMVPWWTLVIASSLGCMLGVLITCALASVEGERE